MLSLHNLSVRLCAGLYRLCAWREAPGAGRGKGGEKRQPHTKLMATARAHACASELINLPIHREPSLTRALLHASYPTCTPTSHPGASGSSEPQQSQKRMIPVRPRTDGRLCSGALDACRNPTAFDSSPPMYRAGWWRQAAGGLAAGSNRAWQTRQVRQKERRWVGRLRPQGWAGPFASFSLLLLAPQPARRRVVCRGACAGREKGTRICAGVSALLLPLPQWATTEHRRELARFCSKTCLPTLDIVPLSPPVQKAVHLSHTTRKMGRKSAGKVVMQSFHVSPVSWLCVR